MKVIAVTLASALVITAVDIRLHYPAVFALRPLVDILATWTAVVAFSLYWKKRFGA